MLVIQDKSTYVNEVHPYANPKSPYPPACPPAIVLGVVPRLSILSSDVHQVKVSVPKSDVRLGRLILCKDSHPLNALEPSVSTFDVSTKSFNLEQ